VTMLVAGIAVPIAALLLMQAAFMSWRLALLGLLSLPVALVGGVLAALINGAHLSLGALIGFLALLGLAARQGMVLIRHFQNLQRHERLPFGAALVRRGAGERLGPIVATAAAAGAAALVFVILGSRPGLEIVSPMAAVILGGLVTATFLNLFVLPTLYLRFGWRQPELSPDEAMMDDLVYARPAPDAREREPVAPGEAGVTVQRAETGGPASPEGGRRA
jgi:Cu/Ag efflux pump CusA